VFGRARDDFSVRPLCGADECTRLTFRLALNCAVAAALSAGPALAVETTRGLGADVEKAAVAALLDPGQETSASGVFLNPAGDVLTARHAVLKCAALYVVKDARIVAATILAHDPVLDLAVLRTRLRPYLSATLAHSLPRSGSGVFTESYAGLQRMSDRSSVLSNALTLPGAEALYLLSGALPGASGSAVLGSDGLLLGMVVERVSRGPGGIERRSGGALNPALTQGDIRVKAIAAPQIAQFLRAQDLPFTQSDVAQLGPQQSPAARAATLAVGIYCR
jgi:serine protease DegQ